MELQYKEKSCLLPLAKHVQEPQGGRFLHGQMQNAVLLVHLHLEQFRNPSVLGHIVAMAQHSIGLELIIYIL